MLISQQACNQIACQAFLLFLLHSAYQSGEANKPTFLARRLPAFPSLTHKLFSFLFCRSSGFLPSLPSHIRILLSCRIRPACLLSDNRHVSAGGRPSRGPKHKQCEKSKGSLPPSSGLERDFGRVGDALLGGGDGREVGGEGEGRKRRGRRRERVNEEKTKDGKVGERTEKEKKG